MRADPTPLADIRLLAMDVDGVLTNGEITYSESGEEFKTFNVKDGQGIGLLTQKGFPVALITARQSSIVTRRAAELGIPYVFQKARPKLAVLERLVAELGIPLSQVAYMGDDLPDRAIMERVGFAACPADAVAEVKAVAHWIADAPGGKGAVRELTDQLYATLLAAV